MANINSVQIRDLSPAPVLSLDVNLPIQRNAINFAEKTTITNLLNFMLNSGNFSEKVVEEVNELLEAHTLSTDPHGDRDYSNSLIQGHSISVDPHGDRAYALSISQNSISSHNVASDPHGDRSYTRDQIDLHSISSDPHGDRAYADLKTADVLSQSKNYVDNEISTKLTNQLNVSIPTIVNGKLNDNIINQKIHYSARTSFPSIGVNNALYVDTTNKKFYQWINNNYVSITPEVTSSSLNITTDDITQGEDNTKQFLTENLKEIYNNKLNDIIPQVSENSIPLVKNKINGSREIKNLQGSLGVDLIEADNNIIIANNKFTYDVITENADFTALFYNTEFKDNGLVSLDSDYIYNITGDICANSFAYASNRKYITDTETFKIKINAGLKGVLDFLTPPSGLSININNNIVTGTSIPNKNIVIYNSEFEQISNANVLANGTFSASLQSAITDGSPIYVYTKDNNYLSESVKLNTNYIREATGLGLNSTKLIITGVGNKNSEIVLKENDVVKGTATTNEEGFFTLTSTTIIDIESTNVYTLTTTLGSLTKTQTLSLPSSAFSPLKELVLNNSRTILTGKGEPNSLVTVLVNESLIHSFVIDSSGIFDEKLNVPTENDSVIFVTELNSNMYEQELKLPTYINEESKPKSNSRLISSDFSILDSEILKVNNKDEYTVQFVITNENAIDIRVKNNTGKLTKWVANLELNKIEL